MSRAARGGQSVLVETAFASLSAGQLPRALDEFLQVPSDHPDFHVACLWAIWVAAKLGTVTFPLMDAVRTYLAQEPPDPAELDALAALVRLYEANELLDDAIEVLDRIRRTDPDHPAVAEHSAIVSRSDEVADLAAVVEQDMSFWDRGRDPRAVPPPAEVAPAVEVDLPQAAGDLIAGRYQLEAEIGRGGMGTVFRALDTELGQLVAVKVFSRPLGDPSLTARFKQELRLCREITHPNVVRVHDIGTHEGRKFITMELLSGHSLRVRMRDSDLRTVLSFLEQVCAALEQVHAAGIVHRDLKPANVFVTESGVVKLMDFGIAKKVDQPQTEGLTASGFMAGTPGYMAPEQVTGFGTAGQAADLYALGVILYEVLAGRRPYRAANPAGVVHAQLTEDPEPPSAVRPVPHPALEELALRLLDRDAARRPSSDVARSVLSRFLATG